MSTNPPSEPDSDLDASRAPFLEHLEELRWRLWRMVLAVIIAIVACYVAKEYLFAFLTRPLSEAMVRLKLGDAVSFRSVTGAFMFYLRTSALFGLFIATPYILFQIWQFVAPGLYRREQRIVLPFVLASTACFFGGALFAYYLVLPDAFEFMLDYSVTSGNMKMLPDINIEDYLGFVIKLLLGFAIAFELPVAISFLAGVGLVTHRGLLKIWRFAIVAIFILAAVLTPPDVFSQLAMAIPLMLLYGISIGLAYFISKRRAARPTAPDAG